MHGANPALRHRILQVGHSCRLMLHALHGDNGENLHHVPKTVTIS